MAEKEKRIKLLVLFSTLEETDKDMVISMSESLVKRCKNNLKKKTDNFSADDKKSFL